MSTFSGLTSELLSYQHHVHSILTETDSSHELAAQILLVAIKQARSNSAFGQLNRISQNCILGHLWSSLFLLRSAYWPAETSALFLGATNTIRYLRHLNLDSIDVELLENILLCRADLLDDVEQILLAESLLKKTLDELALRKTLDRRRFSSILLIIPLLFTPPAAVLHNILFKPVIGAVPIETVIATI